MTENPFADFLKALQDKDAALYSRLCDLSPSEFCREWQAAHPEDFPQGGASPAHRSSVKASPAFMHWSSVSHTADL